MAEAQGEVRLYRGLLLLVGAIYLVWWAAVHALLPHAFNPLPGRLAVVAIIFAVAASTAFSALVRRHVRLLWIGSLWLVTAHYYYLFYGNAGDINWVVGALITVTAICFGLHSRASLVAYSIFNVVFALGLTLAIPAVRQSLFLPGLATVLLQANVGLLSRLGAIRNLAISNEHFQLLFNSTFEGIFVHENGRIVQVNDALVRMFGFSREELLGRHVLDIMHKEDYEAIASKRSVDLVGAYELRGVKKDGTIIELQVQSKPFEHMTRESRLVTLQDITERKRQAAALLQSHEALERSNMELQRFASVASHDLQTPLRSIASFVDLLGSTYGDRLDAQGKDWLSRAGEAAKHLQRLIQDLLDYARIESRLRPFARVSMTKVTNRALALLDVVVKESKAEVTVGELPEVQGDSSQLVQLVLNLVDNAIKYRGDKTPIVHVSAERKNGDWVFAVRDNGIGIAPKHHDRVFEIFKRLHDQKDYPGTGIGLAVCKRVVAHHGGHIWVESDAGAGCVFHFAIPTLEGESS